MTREELSKILEKFAFCILYTSMNTDWTPDKQYSIILGGINRIVTEVMIVNDRNRLTTPSAN